MERRRYTAANHPRTPHGNFMQWPGCEVQNAWTHSNTLHDGRKFLNECRSLAEIPEHPPRWSNVSQRMSQPGGDGAPTAAQQCPSDMAPLPFPQYSRAGLAPDGASGTAPAKCAYLFRGRLQRTHAHALLTREGGETDASGRRAQRKEETAQVAQNSAAAVAAAAAISRSVFFVSSRWCVL